MYQLNLSRLFVYRLVHNNITGCVKDTLFFLLLLRMGGVDSFDTIGEVIDIIPVLSLIASIAFPSNR